jgi:RNA-directed DNA polymerase
VAGGRHLAPTGDTHSYGFRRGRSSGGPRPGIFRRIKGRDWRFAEKDKALLTLVSFRKKPHTKIDGSRNPCSPEDEDYFDARLARKMESDLKGRRKLAWLWYWQEGLCPCCKQKITKETGWHIHHVVKRSEGGSEQMSNLQLLHPNCHRQHHATE